MGSSRRRLSSSSFKFIRPPKTIWAALGVKKQQETFHQEESTNADVCHRPFNRDGSLQAADLRCQVYPPDTQARYVNTTQWKG